MPLLSGITSFFDRYVLGYALGTASGPALEPFVQDLANLGWEANQVLPLDAETAAGIVAEDVEKRGWGEGESALTGVNKERFDALLGEALNAPGMGELYGAWRRGLVTDAQFVHGLRKAKLEPEWDDAMRALRRVLLSPQEAATARQQNFLTADQQRGIANAHGLTDPDAEIQFDIVGLPPGVETALQMLRRNIIDEPTFRQIVAEGHTKTKYTDALLGLEDVVLTASTYATLHLKGWISEQAMIAGGALTGYSADDMRQMYLSMGRPAAPGQLWTAWARKVDGPAGRPMDEAQFTKAIAESDIRPEYAPMLWNIRYAYPPLFQISRLVTSGAIDADTAADWAAKDRYAPEVIAALRASWEGGTTATADPHIGRAQTQLWTATHKSYVVGECDEATARENMTAAAVSTAAQDDVIGLWNRERELIRKTLTPSQVKKAFRDALYSRDTAVSRLMALGYTADDAATLLDE